ncbi:MAG: 2-C-methyl-D-erythritol 2,4-cyclodiphosphate synthase [Pyrinomonadaceae bacterium]|nr:2-C-methyl-D-erythritol 2,4-cyclodiphosphate synthase [Pyrinomonadaceae bacterium]MDQ3586247.1 2-C-methyl-D-erythritol 2,4-cyclodiphosphate synthase [Acidobacteriota bacterium]
MFRIGIGHDTHRLTAGRPLVLGGVLVPSEKGAEGHSDADALTHAICDAILGALCAGDIGQHFPDRDPQWKDVESLQLLARVVWLAKESGYHVVNVDSTVLLERPQLRQHIPAMREKLAGVLEVDASCMSVKAKTGEGLDAVGEARAVTAQAIILLAVIEK